MCSLVLLFFCGLSVSTVVLVRQYFTTGAYLGVLEPVHPLEVSGGKISVFIFDVKYAQI